MIRSRVVTVTVINPATEETIATLESAGVDETDAAVAARPARRFPLGGPFRPLTAGGCSAGSRRSSKSTTRSSRGSSPHNVGKPIAGARGEVGMVADVFHFYAGAVDKRHGETIPVAGGIDMTFREPLGVVGLIVPWNFPLNISSWKLGPALACGNTVVLKPAELTPLSALRLAELALEAGIPEGVLNVVVGKGSVVGQRLVEHPDVAKIGFTGSDRGRPRRHGRRRRDDQARHARARRQVRERRLRRRRPREGRRRRALRRLRQRRPGLLRALAHPRRAQRLRPLRRAARRRDAQRRRSATRRDDATEMGPLISAQPPRDRRELRRRRRRSSKATTPDGKGYWFPCTLVEATNDDRIARDEVFGPVAALIPFDDEADAIRIANDTPYGLSGSIWTQNGARALRVARALDTGVLSINSNSSSVRVSTPFGGFKQSGFGRELGMHALDGYSEVKNVYYSTEG